ncbi:hypothetical protein DUI87_31280 [Hirundo rustica rustica]|uniref:SH3 domain-containing protein n=1 Tax=Hirundo rustica rustica TaxID=333673 RepID=A0A3M0J076_HIRRU|nr:hypothetical protein DUI87_31280 [Hirundo rustica rustica]
MSGTRCQALYPFSGERHRQGLRFAAGELITVLQVPDGGWWEGQKEDGLRGWFPASYVQLLELLQALSGGLEENADGWRFLLKAVMEAVRAGGAHGRDEPEMACLCELWRGYRCQRAKVVA